jgi:SAM-dependent methyltransferase
MTTSTTAPCRLCGSTPTVFLDLGMSPLSDRILDAKKKAEPEPMFPLDVAFCSTCSLVQLQTEVPPEMLYGDDYPYYSSTSTSLIEHSRQNAERLIAGQKLDANSLVVELASNDGYMLAHFAAKGIPVLGIDPAEGPAKDAIAKGIPTLIDYWGPRLANELRAQGKQADVIIANNVMAHIGDLNGFVSGIATLLSETGVTSIENPCIQDLIDHCEFDTIYHEHHSYFSCTSVDALMRRNGLFLNDFMYFPKLHGGTFRWICGKQEAPTDRMRQQLADEAAKGLKDLSYYATFSDRVEQLKADLLALLRGLKAEGKSIAAYGAAAKAATLINYVGIDTGLVDFVVDRNPHKHGCWMPGGQLPILAPQALLDHQPDYCIIFAWNLFDEIASQQTDYIARGGQFIVPVPTPKIVTQVAK